MIYMKRIYQIIATAVAATVLVSAFCGCQRDEDNPEEMMEVSTEALEFPVEGGTKEFSITTNQPGWKFERIPSVGTFLYLAGDEGENHVTVSWTMPENKSFEKIEDSIIIRTPSNDEYVISISQEAAVKVLSLDVYPEQLAFSSNAQSGTFMVTPVNLDSWTATSEDSWISCEVAKTPNEEGRYAVTVTVDENTSYEEDRYGFVTVSAEGVESKSILIGQFCKEKVVDSFLWNRPSTSRMNLKGKVKTMSAYSNFCYPDDKLINLSFDTDGNLSGFGTENYIGDEVTAKITYSNGNRIDKITAKWSGDSYYEIDFTYGDHGKWVPTWNLFSKLTEFSIDFKYKAWFPAVIKNLIGIDVIYHKGASEYEGESNGKTTLNWTVTESGLHLGGKMSYSWGDSVYSQDINYDGAWPVKLTNSDNAVIEYVFNPENGYRISECEYSKESEPNGKTLFNDDTINSLKGNDSSDEYTAFNCTYDDFMDLVKYNASEWSSYTVAYERDLKGNWTKATVKYSYMDMTIDNAITYFE